MLLVKMTPKQTWMKDIVIVLTVDVRVVISCGTRQDIRERIRKIYDIDKRKLLISLYSTIFRLPTTPSIIVSELWSVITMSKCPINHID